MSFWGRSCCAGVATSRLGEISAQAAVDLNRGVLGYGVVVRNHEGFGDGCGNFSRSFF